MRRLHLFLIALTISFIYGTRVEPAASLKLDGVHSVQPGDTWAALALRYGVDEAALHNMNPHMNSGRQPVIGSTIYLPNEASERSGRLIRRNDGGLLQIAAQNSLSAWTLAKVNGLDSPYDPILHRPLYVPAEGIVRDLPLGIETLELSLTPAAPGQALGLRGTLTETGGEFPGNLSGRLSVVPVSFATAGDRFIGVVGTGAFFTEKEPELLVQIGSEPAWIQPWAFSDREWEYQELTLTGETAEIDQQARDEERARLREIWTKVTPEPRWDSSFVLPVSDFLQVSANYGARRSYNGGPYLTYHEGVDFSAYAGTPVYAPAAGTVVLAERLYVRGGTVIIDHGLGIYSGFYHLSSVHASAGQEVKPGDLLGEVGTTGLSTGNHLHWDMLVNGIWVDAAAWQAQGFDCWLLDGLGKTCVSIEASE